jgi:D-lactate dehydrogenase (cytochrome)
VNEQAQETHEIVAEFGASDFTWTADERERRELWQARHNAYPACIATRPGARSLTTDAAVPLSRLPEAVACAEEIFTGQPFTWSMLGHVADGNFHALLLFDPADDRTHDAAKAASKELTRRIIEMGGTCTGEHGIGLGKRDSLALQIGDATMGVMRAVKQAFDPGNILNPGKILLPTSNA